MSAEHLSNEQKGLRLLQKRRWLRALRSGRLRQTRGRLGTVESGLCCLGVFCLVNKINWRPDDGGQCKGPPELLDALNYQQRMELWGRNDGLQGHRPHSFTEIADYIESAIPCVDDLGAGFAAFRAATLTALRGVSDAK